MYEARRLRKHQGKMVPHAIFDFEEDYLRDWLDWSSTDTDLCLYHYTDAHGLQGILENNEIWCSELEYLNDAQEVKYGLNLIREKVEELKKRYSSDDLISKGLLGTLLTTLNQFPGSFHRVFVACFCERGDLLGQWRGYAEEGGGYSIGFTFNDEPQMILDEGKSYCPNLRRVMYDKKRQKYIVDGYLEKICQIMSKKIVKYPRKDHVAMSSSTALHAMNTLMGWIVSFKHPGFKEEEEWRLMRMPRSTGEAASKAYHRIADGLAVPYLKTTLSETRMTEAGDPEEHFPISEIRYGPTLPEARTESSISSLLETASLQGERKIEVDSDSIRAAEVPFRG